MLRVAQRKGARLVAVVAAAGLVLTPAIATSMPAKKRAARRSAEFRSGLLLHAGQRRSQACRRAWRQGSGTDRLQVHARSGQRPAVAGPGCDPCPSCCTGPGTADRRFGTGGDADCLDPDRLQSRSRGRLAALRGLRRRGQGEERRSGDWRPRERSTRSQLLAQQPPEHACRGRGGANCGNPVAALRRGDNVSLDAGASYSLSRRIALTGGVRYNIESERLSALQDDRRDSQAVYVGTAFKF